MTEQKLREILEQKVEVPVMVDNKLKNTYAQLEGRERPAKRKGPRTVRVALIAAVLAVAGALCVAAGVPARVFHLAAGGMETYEKIPGGPDVYRQIGGSRNPIAEENGRLWLTIKEEDPIDITGLVDADTPYIYDNTDPETGLRDYLIVGGTPGDYGWVEYYEVEDNCFASCGNGNTYTEYATIDGVTYTLDELTPEQRERTENYVWNNDEGVKLEMVNRPWHDAAIEQLGIYKGLDDAG